MKNNHLRTYAEKKDKLKEISEKVKILSKKLSKNVLNQGIALFSAVYKPGTTLIETALTGESHAMADLCRFRTPEAYREANEFFSDEFLTVT